MSDDDSASHRIKRVLIAGLIRKAGITETQAGELVDQIGTSWPRLLREAHMLSKTRPGRG